jgi:hypothetical protein
MPDNAHRRAKHLRAYWREHNLGWPINGTTALLAGAGFMLAVLASGLIQDVGLNLAFMSLGVLFTVYLVNVAIKRREDRRWAGADNVAQRFLRRAATQYLNSVSTMFAPGWKEAHRIDVIEERLDFEMAHLKLARDPAWRSYLHENVFPQAEEVGYKAFAGDHGYLTHSLLTYRSLLVEMWPMMSARWTPEQITEVLELIYEIPRQAHLLDVHTSPGVNAGPAELKRINERSLRLVELCNTQDDPTRYILAYDH